MTLSRTTAGVFTIAPTPFHPDGAVDEVSLDRLIDFYESVGVDGVTILGNLGEAPKLEQEEALAIARRVIARTALPVVVGVSAPGYAAMRALSDTAMDAGAAGVMIAPPNTLRTDDQIVDYYSGAANAIGAETPFVLQDYPLTFTVQMSVPVISRIAANHPGCVMLKHEDWPGLEKISRLRQLEESGTMPRLSILTGNGALFLDFEMARGADGAMTGYCFPEMLVELVRASGAGDRDRVHDLFDAHLPLIRYEQQPGAGLAVRKYVLQKRGVLDSDGQRAPGAALSPRAREEVDLLLGRLERALGGELPTAVRPG